MIVIEERLDEGIASEILNNILCEIDGNYGNLKKSVESFIGELLRDNLIKCTAKHKYGDDNWMELPKITKGKIVKDITKRLSKIGARYISNNTFTVRNIDMYCATNGIKGKSEIVNMGKSVVSGVYADAIIADILNDGIIQFIRNAKFRFDDKVADCMWDSCNSVQKWSICNTINECIRKLSLSLFGKKANEITPKDIDSVVTSNSNTLAVFAGAVA